MIEEMQCDGNVHCSRFNGTHQLPPLGTGNIRTCTEVSCAVPGFSPPSSNAASLTSTSAPSNVLCCGRRFPLAAVDCLRGPPFWSESK